MASVITENGIYLRDSGPGAWTGVHDAGGYQCWWLGVEVEIEKQTDIQVATSPSGQRILNHLRDIMGLHWEPLPTVRAADMSLVLVLLPQPPSDTY